MSGDIWVSGQPGRIAVRTGELREAADRCADSAALVGSVGVEGLAESPAILAVPGSELAPETLAAVTTRIVDFELDAGGEAVQASLLAGSLIASAEGYERAEQFVASTMGPVLEHTGMVLGLAALPAAAGVTMIAVGAAANPLVAAAALLSPAGGALVMAGSGLVIAGGDGRAGRVLQRVTSPSGGQAVEHVATGFTRGLFMMVPGAPGPEEIQDTSDVAALLLLVVRGASGGRALPRTDVAVHEVPAEAGRPVPEGPPDGLGDLFGRTSEQNKEVSGPWSGNDRGENGEVRVEEVVQADGSSSWIVHVPGTTDWSMSGTSTTDLASNLEAVAAEEAAAMQAVREAMAAAGIEPGEEVMLSGYSQGGIVASRLAADRDFLRRFDVTAVVTVGSPVAGADIPEHVDVLHLQHADDLVPLADGGRNPEGDRRVTVTVDPPEGGATDRRPHSSGAYRKSIDHVEASGVPEVEDFLRRQREFFAAGGGTTGAVRDFYGRRRPEEREAQDRGRRRPDQEEIVPEGPDNRVERERPGRYTPVQDGPSARVRKREEPGGHHGD